MSAIALIVRPVKPSVGFIVVGFFSDGELADAIVLYIILLFLVNTLLTPASRPPLRNRRNPVTDLVSQPTSRYLSETSATDTVPARSVPFLSDRNSQSVANARNTLRCNVLWCAEFPLFPVHYMAPAIFPLCICIVIGSF
jgi:hypothetical protein